MVKKDENVVYDVEQRVLMPGILRRLPFGLGYETIAIYRLGTSREQAERIAEMHGTGKYADRWDSEHVPVIRKERG